MNVVETRTPAGERTRSDPRSEAREAADTAGSTAVEVSVAVPITERPEALVPLYREYAASLREAGESFEFLFLAPPWGRALTEPLEALVEGGEPIRILEVGQGASEAALIKIAGERCRGRVLVTLPAYYRVEADALPRLVERVRAGTDMAVARRHPRRDPWINRIQTRLFHGFLGRFSGRGHDLHDIACGVRAMRPELLAELPLYGDVSRFLPLLALQEGFRVEEVAIAQHARDSRTRVYGPGVYLRRLIDLLGVLFVMRFVYKPLRFFGLLGSGFSLAGGIILLVLTVQWFQGQAMADRPMLLLGVLFLTFGVQAIALGLVGEMIVHLHAPEQRGYRLREAAGDEITRDERMSETREVGR